MIKEKENKFNWVTFIFFIPIIAYPIGYCIMWDGLLQELIQRNQGMDNFCKLHGYNESTSYKSVGNTIFAYYIKVECDKKVILNWYMNSYCSKIDKWGECLEEDFIVNRDMEGENE